MTLTINFGVAKDIISNTVNNILRVFPCFSWLTPETNSEEAAHILLLLEGITIRGEKIICTLLETPNIVYFNFIVYVYALCRAFLNSRFLCKIPVRSRCTEGNYNTNTLPKELHILSKLYGVYSLSWRIEVSNWLMGLIMYKSHYDLSQLSNTMAMLLIHLISVLRQDKRGNF